MGKPAVKLGDAFSCPLANPQPHGGGVIQVVKNRAVFIEKKPAARAGDQGVCAGTGAANIIAGGSKSVFINNKPAARRGDSMAHGGAIVAGALSVNIG
jgi:uncharacterized Zn-binding protein involved in type VI secretion